MDEQSIQMLLISPKIVTTEANFPMQILFFSSNEKKKISNKSLLSGVRWQTCDDDGESDWAIAGAAESTEK